MHFSEVVSGAELIFEGRVEAVEVRQQPGEMIKTWVRFAVVDVLKGDFADDEIELSFLGGRLGDRAPSQRARCCCPKSRGGFGEEGARQALRREVPLGQLLIAASELDNQWNYRASFVDEFIQRELIGPESLDLWKENYKAADEYCCLFVVHGDFAGFVYIPFPED